MSIKLEILEAEALKLAPAERSRLAARLNASLAGGSEVGSASDRRPGGSQADLASGSADEVHVRMAIGRLLARLPR